MASGRTILKNLNNLDSYLGRFPLSDRARWFERLTVEALSHVFYLPFYTADTGNSGEPYRVVWHGSDARGTPAPSGGSDGIGYCYGFYIMVEATLKTGANQWTQEFGQAIRHCDDFVDGNSVPLSDVCILLIARQLHQDTYHSLRNLPRSGYNFIPFETTLLAKILETAVLAFTMKQIEFQGLMRGVSAALRSSTTLREFRATAQNVAGEWQKDVLKLEKDAFIGVKSYEAMHRIDRPAVAVSEILAHLVKHPFVGQYLNIIGEKLSVAEIEKVLVEQSLGHRVGQTIQTDEGLFECVPCVDYKQRSLRLTTAAEDIIRKYN